MDSILINVIGNLTKGEPEHLQSSTVANHYGFSNVKPNLTNKQVHKLIDEHYKSRGFKKSILKGLFIKQSGGSEEKVSFQFNKKRNYLILTIFSISPIKSVEFC